MASPAPLIGIDLIEPDRLRERLDRTRGLDLELFREGELDYCKRQADPVQHLAARFAAKEAVIKALGIDGWDPLEIEVVSGGERTRVLLHGDVAARAAALGVVVTISLTHLPTLAGAVALAMPRTGETR
ncbi:MAG TPA: 4'-phosphopantetheinyl transferase superfamily protein [Gaiellaceae bacterium]|nr:4'-phosphopantetheinyl transferase superfamily protein [Gaiellaceae bacterium]